MNEILDNQEGYQTPQNTPEGPPQYSTAEVHPLGVLVTCAGFFLLGNLICGGLIIVLAKMQGLDFTEKSRRKSPKRSMGAFRAFDTEGVLRGYFEAFDSLLDCLISRSFL